VVEETILEAAIFEKLAEVNGGDDCDQAADESRRAPIDSVVSLEY